MAKPSLIRWPGALTSCLSPRGDALFLLIAVVAILSLLTHELSRRSVLAADFEGFDSDDLDDAEADEIPSSHPLDHSAPPPTTLTTHSSTPESHHGPPPPPIPPQSSDPTSKPPSSLDFWDEDEFEGLPDAESPLADPVSEPLPSPPPSSSDPAQPKPPLSLRTYTVEIACVSFLIAFAINFFTGRRQNETLALAWAAKFAIKDSIFDKNFSLLGTGDGKEDAPLLLKEGQDVFRFYASGRRHCASLCATMELRSRHDLICKILDLVFPKRDTITFEVVMNEDSMDNVVLALARQKMAKVMLKEARDLQRYATLMSPPAGRRWVAEDLAVVTESKEVAGDLINDVVLDQVFGDKAFEKFGKLFITLQFSDQYPGSQKKILMFKFALPDANNMADMTRLITLVPYYIDLVGRYKLSSQARSKTEPARTKAAQEAFKELQNARQEALQRKKAEKKEVIEGKLSAEAVRKKEEKERARQMKKAKPKIKMMR